MPAKPKLDSTNAPPPALTGGWKNRIVGHEEVAPDQILAHPFNWRVHPRFQQAALADVLAQVGWVQDVIVNRTTGTLIDGHLRVHLALRAGEPFVPVKYVDLTADEEALVLATFDPISALAGTDAEKLEELLAYVDAEGDAVNELLEALAENAGITTEAAAEAALDAERLDEANAETLDRADELQEKWQVALGDLWLIPSASGGGTHRILCGDSTRVESYRRLFGDQPPATMVFTDPPWNVAIGLDSNPRHRQRTGLANDNLSPEDFVAFLKGFAQHLPLYSTGDLYCVLGASEWPTLDAAVRSVGYHWSATVIWVKDIFVLGRAKYHRRYEPIWYGWHGKGKSSYVGDRAQDDVWEVPRPKRSEEHPTMKPIALVERAIANSCEHGAVVLDPFMGSGTTLLAAEAQGRVAFGMDLAPKYVAVILERATQAGLVPRKADA